MSLVWLPPGMRASSVCACCQAPFSLANRAAAYSSLMSAAYRPGASNSALYAAALFASENGAWQQAQTLLARIPGGSQTSDMRDLRQRVNYFSLANRAAAYSALLLAPGR